ncbi:ABC transporter ATP-binding protein [Actinomadura rubrobrunea]|uniref:ABC transporter ATP-binding protein n=1 Tax=Actinomadura rubrobrunea TaxID=115335 RepID=A0A9W6PWY8_9ACTN|nr:ABC transporter ATP-binding protein [Actinomadura rubrobrunea]GLW64513.1 ABC transporter ATP-binding protein [Actinomadura rubrobrunea]
MEPILRASRLRKHYGTGTGLVRAVDEVDLDVASGEAVGIIGPSGCGKSTLLHLLGALDRPDGGWLWLGGERIDRLSETAAARLRRRSIGFVFQAFHLVDELTARENVELPALLAGASPRAARRRATALLERVGLADRAGHLPAMLSGGQRQRVAVARALVNDPALLLADEPTGNLDTAATSEVLRLFDDLRAEGRTLVIVTHDSRIAAAADRLITMRDGAFVDETILRRPSGNPSFGYAIRHGSTDDDSGLGSGLGDDFGLPDAPGLGHGDGSGSGRDSGFGSGHGFGLGAISGLV